MLEVGSGGPGFCPPLPATIHEGCKYTGEESASGAGSRHIADRAEHMNPTTRRAPTLWGTLRDDVAGGGFFKDLHEQSRQIRDFYVDDDQRERLRSMSAVKRWLVVGWWVLKSMFFKLTPFRRLLLAVGLVFVSFATVSVRTGSGIHGQPSGTVLVGVLAILVVLLLELKDKLLAHSELREGRAIQRAMQPVSEPAVRGWTLWFYTRPANEVCGDILDLFLLDESHYAVVAGDVAGKGLGAALQMVKIQASIRALASEFRELPMLVARVNELLLKDKLPERFASLLLLQIPENAGTCRYVNAGHMPPLRVSTEQVECLERGNAAVGLSTDVAFEEKPVEIKEGEALVLYSDGVTEAENRSGESFGLERLFTACSHYGGPSATNLGEAIVHAVETFVDGNRQKDDLSLIILKRSSQG